MVQRMVVSSGLGKSQVQCSEYLPTVIISNST
jgi:hypothetical protein